MSDNSIASRIKEARIGSSLSQLEISQKLEITDKTYRAYEKGKDITVKYLKKIAEITKTDLYYLINGGEALPLVPNKAISTDVIAVNFYPEVYAAAGYGAQNGDTLPKVIHLDKAFLDEITTIRKYDKLDIIRVYGDSMEPFVSNGEYVIIEKNSDAKNGETVIANINGDVYIKKFESDPFKKWIKLISDNKNYNEIHVQGENLRLIKIVGIVRAKIKPF